MSRRRIRVAKSYRPLVRAAVAEGWVLTQGRQGHPKLTAPDGYSVPIPSTSSAPGTLQWVRVQLRRHGVPVR